MMVDADENATSPRNPGPEIDGRLTAIASDLDDRPERRMSFGQIIKV
jgi:hypothetical protein